MTKGSPTLGNLHDKHGPQVFPFQLSIFFTSIHVISFYQPFLVFRPCLGTLPFSDASSLLVLSRFLIAFRCSCGFPPIYFQSSGVTLPFTFSHQRYQGFLAFRRRCGETLQDSCCPPGACGLSQTPPPITFPPTPRSKLLQPPSFSLHNWECLPPTANSLPTSPHLSPTPVCNG